MSRDACRFCTDPRCLDDFITGSCPVYESIEECGCVEIYDAETGDTIEVVHFCDEHRPDASQNGVFCDKSPGGKA